MDKCPFCGAETRPGDNFCLNCGNRLLSGTPAPAPVQSSIAGDVTVATPPPGGEWVGTVPAASPVSSWSDASAPTLAASSEQPTYRADPSAPTVQSSSSKIEQPARFVLRADNGDVLQEYALDKAEISIGRAPNSDILLSKDKLTSRRHATVRYENSRYLLSDERSANGTFVNGQQIEEVIPRLLQDGDHVGIGEHELIFRLFNSPNTSDVEDLPTVAVKYDPSAEMTFRTREDELATVATNDDFSTHSMDSAEAPMVLPATPKPELVTPMANGSAMSNTPVVTPSVPVAAYASSVPVASTPASSWSVAATPRPPVSTFKPTTNTATSSYTESASAPISDVGITFDNLTNLSEPALPDTTELIAAMSALDGQVMSLQDQFKATQDAISGHVAGIIQTANQLRAGVRRVSDRMDNSIADVARSREALAWTELLQLMEDVMNNPRDIEYVTKLARKARELNKVFQLHQSVLNTMAECNSLLRSLIGEDK